MKKLGYMLLLSSLTLVLSACGDDTSKSSLNHSSGLGSLDSGLSVDPNNSNSNPNESGSSGGKISSSEQPPIDYTIGWSQDVLDVMEPHLGGHAIPFIDLPGRVLATWIEASSSYSSSTVAHLSILSTGAFDAALAGQAKLTYQKAGWTVDFNRETLQMHAEETKLGMKVDFYGEYDQNDGSTTPQIDVYYNEPFAVPASGAWRSATVQALASIGVAAPHMLPYTYLGTLAEETVSISTTELDIQGKVGGWDTYNSYNPIVPCGVTNTLGNATGVVDYVFSEAQAEAHGAEYTAHVPSYRGIENPFGHIWKWTDGVLGKGVNDEYQEIYVSRDPAQYASTLNDSYVDMGHEATANGYCKAILASDPSHPQEQRVYGDIFDRDDSGSASTFFCDYHYHANANNSIYGLQVGGYANGGAYDGLAFLSVNSAPAGAYAYFGSRLCWSE